MTTAVGSMDIDIDLLVLCGAWWSIDTQTFQMVVEGNFSSLLVLKNKIKVCLRWDVSSPTTHVVSCKRLSVESLHTFVGMVGCCIK